MVDINHPVEDIEGSEECEPCRFGVEGQVPVIECPDEESQRKAHDAMSQHPDVAVRVIPTIEEKVAARRLQGSERGCLRYPNE